MTDLVTFTLPAAWLDNATSCALYIFNHLEVDVIHFDLDEQHQPVLRYPPAELTIVQQKGDPHAPVSG